MSLYERASSRKRKAEEWLALGLAAASAWNTASHFYTKYQERKERKGGKQRYLITVEQSHDETLFWVTTRWIMTQVTERERQHVFVGQYRDTVVEVPSSETERYWLEWSGHDILVKIEAPDMGGDGKLMMISNKFSWGKTLTIECPTLQVRRDFVAFMQDLLPKVDEETYIPSVYRAKDGGDWSWVKKLVKRSPSTLVLAEGQFEEIRADIQKFKGDQQRYVDLGIPWHRGYLLKGPPGTGKSSTICTLASEFRSDVYFLSVAELKDGGALIHALSECDSGDFLVLEDVDTARATSGDGDGKEEAIFDTLLNTLDGVLTPDGLIVIMTTNHPDRLDPRLIRPGRVDRQYELSYMTQDQLDRMLQGFLGVPHGTVSLTRDDLVAAEVIECLKSSIDFDSDYVLWCIREVATGPLTRGSPLTPPPLPVVE